MGRKTNAFLHKCAIFAKKILPECVGDPVIEFLKRKKQQLEETVLKNKSVRPQYSPLWEQKNANVEFRIAYFNGCPDGRSERYRINNIVDEFTRCNIIADVYSYGSLKKLSSWPLYDLLILFRCANCDQPEMQEILKKYKAGNIAILYDTDDYLLDRTTEHDRKKVIDTINWCDGITVTTEYLANLYRHALNKKCWVIRNSINPKQYKLAQQLEPSQKRKTVNICYLCGTNTHDEDFSCAEKALYEVLSAHSEARLYLIGPLSKGRLIESVRGQIVRKKYMPYLQLQRLTAKMDINIAPLVVDDFNQSKSEIKIFEAALVGVPTIASPIQPYKNLITSGKNGYIASTHDEWKKQLETLISSPELRSKMGEQARRDFVETYRVENVAKTAIQIYRELIDYQKDWTD